ncbi:MAG: hypothetical protein ACW99F_00960 [Candidatus Hodarchaeales archaeon]|jgi:shikimate dehydrogenase
MPWINKDTEIYCSFAKNAGNTGCQMMNSAFYYYGLNKIYKSFSVDSIEDAVVAVKTLGIKGFAITMPYKKQVLSFVDELDDSAKIGAANTVINTNGILKAYNTDYYAALEKLAKYDRKRLYILGDGGYSSAVQSAAKKLSLDYHVVNRRRWSIIEEISDSIVYNCTPVESLENVVQKSNIFIDCLVNTKSGKELATMQASHQFKLYTGLQFPIGVFK